jgi:small subunit ribosomal protein S21
MSRKIRKEDMIVWGNPNAVNVVDGNLELAIKFWKRKLKESGKLQELKDRRYYTKPSEKRRKEIEYQKRLSKFKKH